MASLLPSVFRKKNILNAKVLEKAEARSWQTQPLVLRLLTQEQQEMLVVASDQAKISLMQIEKGIVYDFTIPGACMKKSDAQKTGVDCSVEARLRYRVEFVRAKEGWPTKIPFQFKNFVDLAQIPDGAWVDVVGFVDAIGEVCERDIRPENGISYTLVSRDIVLRSGEFHEILQLLGEHTTTKLQTGDILAVRQAKMTTWNQVRQLSTGIVTHLIVNPSSECGVQTPVKAEDPSSPTKKAAGMKDVKVITLTEVCHQRESMKQAVRNETEDSKKVRFEGVTRAMIEPFDEAIFEAGFPFFGSDDRPQMKFPVVLKDSSSFTLPVTLWNDACCKLFGVDAAHCVNLWGDCESSEGKVALLAVLNKRRDETLKFWFTFTTWCPDDDVTRAVVRVSVNQVTDIGE